MTADPGLQATERFMCILLSVCSVTLGVAKALMHQRWLLTAQRQTFSGNWTALRSMMTQ